MSNVATAQSQAGHDQALMAMATTSFTNDVVALLRSRAPLIYLTCNEEKRVLKYFKHLAAARGYRAYVWDCYLGLRDLFTGEKSGSITSDITHEDEILNYIAQQSQEDIKNAQILKSQNVNGTFYLLMDYHRFINPDQCSPSTERRLKHLAQIESPTSVIITAPDFRVTPALQDTFSLIDFPYPSSEEIKSVLWKIVEPAKRAKLENIADQAKEKEEAIVTATKGMNLAEVGLALSKSLVLHHQFDINTIIKEKEQIIKKKGGGAIEFFAPQISFKEVGGLEVLVEYLRDRKKEFGPRAEKFGVKRPKGILLLGPPGVGKSLLAKAVANEFGVPLLGVDIGALYGSLVGESEKNLREMFKLAEVMSPCVLWWDEIEKMISASSGESDGGTSSRIFKTILTWMQERQQPVFIVATANNHEGIPSEFMRAGRFDEIWFVGLPNKDERKQIASVLIRLNGRNPDSFDLDKIAMISNGYSGAEIGRAVESAVKRAFKEDERDVVTEDIIQAIALSKPLSIMRKQQIESMSEWAKENCKIANIEEPTVKSMAVETETSFSHMEI